MLSPALVNSAIRERTLPASNNRATVTSIPRSRRNR
ncbi:hypothetical protein SAMN05216506_109231, partial [Saccharopolyspora kobensis]